VGTTYYYCVITQDVSGCEVVSNTSEVIITTAPDFTQQPISNTLCLGDPTPDLNVAYVNGAGTATYQWYVNTVNNNTTGTQINAATTNTYTPDVTSAGTLYYYCIIQFASGGCSEIVSTIAQITVNETPNISNYTDLICSDNTFIVIPDSSNGDIVPSGTLYTWTNPAITPIGSISGASEQTIPTASISQHLVNNTTNVATVIYTVTPVSGDCIGNTFEVEVTVNPSISVIETLTDSPCFNDNDGAIEINISGGIPFTTGNPYQINWLGPNGYTSTNQNINNLEPGDYTVQIDDNGGCPFTETYTIQEPDELILTSLDIHDDISCFGEADGEIAVTISGGTQPYTYGWTKDNIAYADTEDISNLGAGIYQLTITDANNCVLTLNSLENIEPELLEATLISQTNIECFGNNTGAITVNVNGGRPNYSFFWTGPNGYTSNSQNLNTLYAGTYILTVTDASLCETTLEVVLIENDEIQIDTELDHIRCYGTNEGRIEITNIAGGIAPYAIAWSNFGGGMIQDNLAAGMYTIIITDALDCSKEFDIEIEDAPIFTIDPQVTQISCAREDDASIVLNLVGGVAPVTVSWNDDPNAGIDRHNLSAGTYTVTLTDSSLPLPSCSIQQSFIINPVLPLEIAAVVTDALDCDIVNSGAINLSISGGTIASGSNYQIDWSNGASFEDLNDIGPGFYSVTVYDDNGCSIQGQWEVKRFDPLELGIDTETIVDCDTKNIQQIFTAIASGGVPPFQFTWSSGTVSGTNNETMTTTLDGLVTLEVTDGNGCTTSVSHNVDIPIIGEADFTTNSIGYSTYGIYSIHDPIQFTNAANGDFESIRWDFGDGNFSTEENPTHTYLAEGSYVVTQTVTYPFGCVYTHIITLTIEKGYSLVMPNAFTPNKDGLNEYFTPVFIGLSDMRLDIYDTWGSLIYSETGDDLQGWNGMIKETEAENGNYYYKFSAKTFYGELKIEEGAFVLIK
jgi:gliding motility-associated-like protein